ncbi:hypothetical protein AB5I41_11285 [Sphingomonas sp. MMS24-JH45]
MMADAREQGEAMLRRAGLTNVTSTRASTSPAMRFTRWAARRQEPAQLRAERLGAGARRA